MTDVEVILHEDTSEPFVPLELPIGVLNDINSQVHELVQRLQSYAMQLEQLKMQVIAQQQPPEPAPQPVIRPMIRQQQYQQPAPQYQQPVPQPQYQTPRPARRQPVPPVSQPPEPPYNPGKPEGFGQQLPPKPKQQPQPETVDENEDLFPS